MRFKYSLARRPIKYFTALSPSRHSRFLPYTFSKHLLATLRR